VGAWGCPCSSRGRARVGVSVCACDCGAADGYELCLVSSETFDRGAPLSQTRTPPATRHPPLPADQPLAHARALAAEVTAERCWPCDGQRPVMIYLTTRASSSSGSAGSRWGGAGWMARACLAWVGDDWRLPATWTTHHRPHGLPHSRGQPSVGRARRPRGRRRAPGVSIVCCPF
jgi:hypothetical protein